MKHVLAAPALYQIYQELGGFFGARVKAIGRYLTLAPGARVIDIGCGPGYIRRHLPASIDYVGFDIDAPSIEHARRRFGGNSRFECRLFDAAAAAEFGPADVVMMNGVMHHIGDDDLIATLGHVRAALRPDGVLFTLDGCYRPGQSRLDKWLLDNDRGRFVRDRAGYETVLKAAFDDVALHVHDDLSRVPYTFVIGLARAPAPATAAAAAAAAGGA